MKTPKILSLIVLNSLFAANLAFAQTWTQTSAPVSSFWTSVASSADGTNLVAAAGTPNTPQGIYASTNSGASWSLTGAPNEYWMSVASSADGKKLVAGCDGPIYVSTNAGLTWAQTSAPSNFWCSVASSADGSKFAAAAARGVVGFSGPSVIYTSTNSGLNWVSNNVRPFGSWCSIAMSADGNKLVAAAFTIWRSTNFGAVWTRDDTAPMLNFLTFPSQILASSADGSKLVLAFPAGDNTGYTGIPGPIYTSTNSGDTWTLTTCPSNHWNSVASSADGTKLIAVGGGNQVLGPIYTSTNSGLTWILNNVPLTNWFSVASSADGGTLIAAALTQGGDNPIYTFRSIQQPLLLTTLANSNFTLSWLVPSTNFVLQQSADLSGWTDLTNQPVLNLTNLQMEVSLLLTGGNGFFRLKTP